MNRVRELVRYVWKSLSRLRKFKEISKLFRIDYRACLSLNVPTRWNSMYIMLKTACIYEKAFEKYNETDSSFHSDMGDDMLDYFDWGSVLKLVDLL